MKAYLNIIKNKSNQIYNFYLFFNRENVVKLIWPTILLSAYTYLIYFLFSYLSYQIYYPGNGLFAYLEHNFGIIYLAGVNAQYLGYFTILNISLIAPYYLNSNNNEVTLIQCIKSINEKQWTRYLLSLFIFGLLIKIPNLLINTESSRLMGVVDVFDYYHGQPLNYWLTDLFKLIVYIVTIVFSYLIINISSVGYKDLYSKRKFVLIGILSIFALDTIFNGLNNSVLIYITPPLAEYLDMPVINTFISFIPKILFCISIPIYIFALTNKETVDSITKEQNLPKEEEEEIR